MQCQFVELNVPAIFTVMAKLRELTPWWLDEGTEICSPCGQTYAYQTEFRCAFCDGPLCPMCVELTVATEFACPGCREAAAAEGEN